MALFLVRHGETQLSGRYCGSLNPPLSPRGRRHIASVATHLKGIPIAQAYVSPQRRAQQTALILKRRLKFSVKRSEALKELRFGMWEGLRFEDVEKKWPGLAKRWADNPLAVRIPKAESFHSLRRRVRRFLSSLNNSFKTSNILIVAHGASLAAIVIELTNRPMNELPKFIQPLGSVRKIQGQSMKWITPC